MLVMNMNNVFRDVYFKAFNPKERNNRILKNAQTIISANMAQGDALTRKTSTGKDIVFSEWKPIGKDKVQRTEYTFDAVAKGETSSETVNPHYEQLSLLEPSPDQTESKPPEKHYKLVKWEDVYKQIIE